MKGMRSGGRCRRQDNKYSSLIMKVVTVIATAVMVVVLEAIVVKVVGKEELWEG